MSARTPRPAANPGLQPAAAPLGALAFLAREEAAKAAETNAGAADRPGEPWKRRATERRCGLGRYFLTENRSTAPTARSTSATQNTVGL